MVDVRPTLRQLLEEHSIMLSDRQLDQFETYYRELVSWNEKMNLTAITDREQVYMKHFYDSLSLAMYHPMSKVQSLADIGSGAGFPSIPLKIVFPHLKVTIVDSLQKRIGFLHSLINTLELEQVQCIHGRAEDVARMKEHREQYDLVTARAVARFTVLSELCLPFASPQGYFIAMKGSNAAEELEEGKYAVKELGGVVASDHMFQLPPDQSGRHIIIIKKMKHTSSKYPRKAGVPLKSPLLAK